MCSSWGRREVLGRWGTTTRTRRKEGGRGGSLGRRKRGWGGWWGGRLVVVVGMGRALRVVRFVGFSPSSSTRLSLAPLLSFQISLPSRSPSPLPSLLPQMTLPLMLLSSNETSNPLADNDNDNDNDDRTHESLYNPPFYSEPYHYPPPMDQLAFDMPTFLREIQEYSRGGYGEQEGVGEGEGSGW